MSVRLVPISAASHPSFVRLVSDMRELPTEGAKVPRNELAAYGVGCWLSRHRDLTTRSTQMRTSIPTGHGMVNRFTTAQSTLAMRRWGPAAIVTLAAMAALTALTADAGAKDPPPAPPKEATAPREAGEPIMAIVSIKTQHVTFYDAEGWIFRAPVSTGVKEREAPAGVFAVIEKDRDHHSSMYDDAWMPHMQRITWNGIALHGGPLPGYAASPRGVGMPFGLAEEQFHKTRIGMRVIISPDDAAPVEVSHPALLTPNAEAIA